MTSDSCLKLSINVLYGKNGRSVPTRSTCCIRAEEKRSSLGVKQSPWNELTACPLFNSAHASVTISSSDWETFFYALFRARQLFHETFPPALVSQPGDHFTPELLRLSSTPLWQLLLVRVETLLPFLLY